jgi:hypothetical protein
MPMDHDGSLPTLLRRSRLFFEDLPHIHRRRENGDHREVLSDETRGKRPSYHLQNFHFQSGGWMTQESAQRYDTQVEVLLNGTANAIRRRSRACDSFEGTVPACHRNLAHHLSGVSQRASERFCISVFIMIPRD